ncbi:unnamed protein product [Withania somnifera]
MLITIIIILYLGHLYICAMVVVIKIIMTSELFNLLRQRDEDRCLPGFGLLNWYFFFAGMLFVYGRILSQQLVNAATIDEFSYKLVSKVIKYHMVFCYFLYISRLVWFILTLKKKMYKYQFGHFAWRHMVLFVVFTQSSFTVANLFEDIFWKYISFRELNMFLLPASNIAMNDVAACFFDFFFGKTPLFKLSPKKTWEGFIRASMQFANVLVRFQWDLSTGWLQCNPGPLFKPEYYSIAELIQWEISILPVQWHALCLGLFASIIDFGYYIPGHGGFTDRMDCQMVMAIFVYIYYQSFVPQEYSLDMILDQIFRQRQMENY